MHRLEIPGTWYVPGFDCRLDLDSRGICGEGFFKWGGAEELSGLSDTAVVLAG